jgi:multidrug transporter EmrE-like cation transporter
MNLVTLYVICITLSETVGDIGFKYYAKNNQFSYFSIGITGYIGVCYFLVKALQQSNILMVNGMWDGFSTLFEGCVAFFILGERLTHIRQYVGYLLLVLGLFLLQD